LGLPKRKKDAGVGLLLFFEHGIALFGVRRNRRVSSESVEAGLEVQLKTAAINVLGHTFCCFEKIV
jgi:hypothetical protein